MTAMPWGTLIGLLFMTMGPIRALAVFSRVGTQDDAVVVRALANRSAALVAAAFLLTVLVGNAVLTAWGVTFPALLGAGGLVLGALSLQALLSPTAATSVLDPERTPAAAIAFPGLFPPIAVSVPLIFATPFPGWETKVSILGIGLALIVANWAVMRRSKAVLRVIGPVPLQLFGAVFGVLQLALALQFILAAVALH